MNQVNVNFMQLLIAVRRRDIEAQKRGMSFFYRLAIGIAFAKRWFHPDGINEWQGIADEAIAEQLRRYESLGALDVLRFGKHNCFAYVYNALKYRLIDEVDRLYRRPKVVHLGEKYMFLPDLNTERDLERRDFQRLIDRAVAHFGANPAFAEILGQIPSFLEDPCDNPRPDLVRRLSESLQVSEQQSRTYLRAFALAAQTDPVLKAVADALRKMSAASTAGRDIWDELLSFSDTADE